MWFSTHSVVHNCWLINGDTNNHLFRLLFRHFSPFNYSSPCLLLLSISSLLTLCHLQQRFPAFFLHFCVMQSSWTLLVNRRQQLLNSVPLSVFILAPLSSTSRQYRVNRCKNEIKPNVPTLLQTMLIRNWNGTWNKNWNLDYTILTQSDKIKRHNGHYRYHVI